MQITFLSLLDGLDKVHQNGFTFLDHLRVDLCWGSDNYLLHTKECAEQQAEHIPAYEKSLAALITHRDAFCSCTLKMEILTKNRTSFTGELLAFYLKETFDFESLRNWQKGKLSQKIEALKRLIFFKENQGDVRGNSYMSSSPMTLFSLFDYENIGLPTGKLLSKTISKLAENIATAHYDEVLELLAHTGIESEHPAPSSEQSSNHFMITHSNLSWLQGLNVKMAHASNPRFIEENLSIQAMQLIVEVVLNQKAIQVDYVKLTPVSQGEKVAALSLGITEANFVHSTSELDSETLSSILGLYQIHIPQTNDYYRAVGRNQHEALTQACRTLAAL